MNTHWHWQFEDIARQRFVALLLASSFAAIPTVPPAMAQVPHTLHSILNNPSPSAGDNAGLSVAISGTRVVVGAYLDDTGAEDAGSAYVYDFAESMPTAPVVTLNNPSPAPGGGFGRSVAVSGALVVIGAWGTGPFHPGSGRVPVSPGSVYIFDLDSARATVPVVTLVNPRSANYSFGASVAVSGTRVVVGAPFDSTGGPEAGIVYVYDLASATPTVPVATLLNPSPASGDAFGYCVAVSGTRVVVGVPYDNAAAPDDGTVFVYDLASDTPSLPVATLNNPSPALFDLFGRSVAVSGTRVVVGDIRNVDIGPSEPGSAYVYDLTSATPTVPMTTLNNPGRLGRESDYFAWAVAISGTWVVVGAYHHEVDASGAPGAGSVYLYDLAGATPTVPAATLSNPSPAANDRFGYSLAVDGTTIIVGAPLDDTGATDAGSAYLYRFADGTDTPPTIVTHPQSQTVPEGSHVTFSVAATGTEPLRYRWSKDGVALPGATNSTLTLFNVTYNKAGNYSAIVTNSAGAALSSNAILTVVASNMVPVVTWIRPTNGASFPVRGDIRMAARAIDSDGSVNFVEFFANSTNLGRVVSSTNLYHFAWSNAPAGTFQLHAEAVDDGGVRGVSDSVQIVVSGRGSTSNRTLYVSQTSPNPAPPYATWDTAAHTIQEAVDAAGDGDTVLVAEGEYRLAAQINIAKAIVLRSDMGADRTLLNGQNNTRCLWISNSVAVVDGFKIWRGYEGSGGVLAGGVVMFGGTLRNCIVQYTFPEGRLVYCSSGGLITDCQIGENRSSQEINGPGVYLTHSQLRNSAISGVQGAGYGAGLYAVASTISGCTISNNWAQRAGGGAYLDGCEVDRCTIVRNVSGHQFGSAGLGGGLFAINSTIRNSLIAGNRANNGSDSSGDGVVPGFGGGVYLRGGTLLNCTVTENTAYGGGGGVYVESGGVRNSIIYFNSGSSTANWYNPGGGTFDHSCTTPDPDGVDNLDEDPQFVDRTNGNYHLASTSPCIDAGANEPWMSGAQDLDGNPRIINGTVDLGAWEVAVAQFARPQVNNGIIRSIIGGLPRRGTIIVEGSTDLNQWQPIHTNTMTGDTFEVVEPINPNGPARFFRARITN